MTAPVSMQSPRGRLTVEFEWVSDRFAHRITDKTGRVLTSVEGTAADAWPASPPIQQLSLEKIDGQDVLLGVGAAGRGHWSISVVATQVGGRDALKFELACRSHDRPVDCKTTYAPGPGSSPSDPYQVDAIAGRLHTTETSHVVVSANPSDDGPTTQWSYLIS